MLMRRNLVPLLGVAFIVAIVSTGIFYGLVVSRLRDSGSAQAGAMVAVAARPLERGAIVQESDILLQPWRGEALPDAVRSIEEVRGATLLHPVSEGRPILREAVAEADAAGGASLAIPPGMRAVSVQVAQPSGILSLLRSGQRVDVQVIATRGDDAELRRVLQNIEVLSKQEGGQLARNTVTLLAKPEEADLLSLADASAQIRLALRNPSDEDSGTGTLLRRAALFQQRPTARPVRAAGVPPVRPAVTPSTRPDLSSRALELRVRVVAASGSILDELGAEPASPRRADLLQVSALRAGSDVETKLGRLSEQRLVNVLSNSRLVAWNEREVGIEAGADWDQAPPQGTRSYGVRVQFLPRIGRDGTLRMKVQPEVSSPSGGAVATRRIETEVELVNGQSFVVSGLRAREGASLAKQLFPSRTDSGDDELFVVVTPQFIGPVQAAALNK